MNLAVIGHPIGHSKSPDMHNAALNNLNISGEYIAIDVHLNELEHKLNEFRNTLDGFNVTIPHKEAIIPFLDEISKTALEIGAVNTVRVQNGKLYGYNTDAYGFLYPLQKRNINLKNKKAIVLGAGGASRAIIWSLLNQGVSKISVGVRNTEKARKNLSNLLNKGVLIFDMNCQEYFDFATKANIAINTTPIGMYPNSDEVANIPIDILPNDSIVYDLIYNPQTTKLLELSQKRGLKIQNGADMLIHQGAKSFYIWTGLFPNTDIMKEALFN